MNTTCPFAMETLKKSMEEINNLHQDIKGEVHSMSKAMQEMEQKLNELYGKIQHAPTLEQSLRTANEEIQDLYFEIGLLQRQLNVFQDHTIQRLKTQRTNALAYYRLQHDRHKVGRDVCDGADCDGEEDQID